MHLTLPYSSSFSIIVTFQLDVSDRGHVWGINRGGRIYRWTGRNWQHIGGRAKQVTVGPSGVWVVNRGNNIYYRRGTYGDPNTAGSGVCWGYNALIATYFICLGDEKPHFVVS